MIHLVLSQQKFFNEYCIYFYTNDHLFSSDNTVWSCYNYEVAITYKMMCGLPWKQFFCHEWGDSAMIFMNQEPLPNHLMRDKILLFAVKKWHVRNKIMHGFMHYFVSCMPFFSLSTLICLKQSSIDSFAIVAKDGVFWLSIVMSTQEICDVVWTRGTVVVTSHSSIVHAHTNWHKGRLH